MSALLEYSLATITLPGASLKEWRLAHPGRNKIQLQFQSFYFKNLVVACQCQIYLSRSPLYSWEFPLLTHILWWCSWRLIGHMPLKTLHLVSDCPELNDPQHTSLEFLPGHPKVIRKEFRYKSNEKTIDAIHKYCNAQLRLVVNFIELIFLQFVH